MSEFRTSSAFRTLLISTSVLGLAAGWTVGAKADPSNGIEVLDNPSAGPVEVGPLDSTDYILVGNSTVEGSISNDGNIGVSASPSANGILVIESEVEDEIVNGPSGTIFGENAGISVVDSLVGGGIRNEGNVYVEAYGGLLQTGAFAADDAVGIKVVSNQGADISTSIDNSGLIDVYAEGSGSFSDPLTAFGIRVASSGNVEAMIDNSGDIYVHATGEGAVRGAGISVGNTPAGDGVFLLVEGGEGGPFGPASLESDVTNSSLSSIDVVVSASGLGATAMATGIGQSTVSTVDSHLDADNSGSINVEANADGVFFALADAAGIEQDADGQGGPGDSAALQITNSGEVDVTALAEVSSAFAEVTALAEATGLSQSADDVESAHLQSYNEGSIEVAAIATASGSDAFAGAEAAGIRQEADATGAVDIFANNTSGSSIDVSAVASAAASITSDAQAEAAGIEQYGFGGDVMLQAENSGAINVSAEAWAQSGNYNHAEAAAIGIGQEAYGVLGDGTATAYALNDESGVIQVSAYALAEGGNFDSEADSRAAGIAQDVDAFGDASGDVDNRGSIGVVSEAMAFGEDARAQAIGDGIVQFIGSESGHVDGDIINSSDSSIDTTVIAVASGSQAEAVAESIGILQIGDTGGTASLGVDNDGTISVSASAYSDDDESDSNSMARGGAAGVVQAGFGRAGMEVEGSNSGLVDVSAEAHAFGESPNAYAAAVGWLQDASAESGNADLFLENSGNILVSAAATAEATDVDAEAYAEATGVEQQGGAFQGGASATLDNSGSIAAMALADADSIDGSANARADAVGVWQGVEAELDAEARITNSSSESIEVTANASASASGSAAAYANADGIGYRPVRLLPERHGLSGYIDNTGAINVDVFATAVSSIRPRRSARPTASCRMSLREQQQQ